MKILYIRGDSLNLNFTIPKILEDHFKDDTISFFKPLSHRYKSDLLSLDKIIKFNQHYLSNVLYQDWDLIISTSLGCYHLLELLEDKEVNCPIHLIVPVIPANRRIDLGFDRKKYKTKVTTILEVEDDEFANKNIIKDYVNYKNYHTVKASHSDNESLISFLIKEKII